MKFGGNVLGSETGIHEVLDVISAQRKIWNNVVVVTAALSGVTDTLHALVQTAQNSNQNILRRDIAEIREIHLQAAQIALTEPRQVQTLLAELDILFLALMDDCERIQRKRQADPALADRVLAMGEMLVSRIVAAAARAQAQKCVAIDANRIIVTDDRHGNARPITSLSRQLLHQNLMPLLERGIVPIVTGYIGANEKGAITTLGRGGSDYSATYLAALLQATEVWFFTDVEGLMSADPEVVRDAQVLTTSSYREVAEMARFGARVLHPRSTEPLIGPGIPLRIRSLAQPGNRGTYIRDHTPTQKNRIHAVTQAVGVRVSGPPQSNMTEVCNQLISQYLNDDIQPTLEIATSAGDAVVYVAPTSANRDSFDQFIAALRTYDTSHEWQIDEVTVIAVIGNLQTEDHIDVLRSLARADVVPSAFGQGMVGAFLLVVRPVEAEAAINSIHTLISH
jgi:aspartate kinase